MACAERDYSFRMNVMQEIFPIRSSIETSANDKVVHQCLQRCVPSAVCLFQMLSTVTGSGLPTTNWLYHITITLGSAIVHMLSLVWQSRTRCLTISRRWCSLSNLRWRHCYLLCTETCQCITACVSTDVILYM